MASVLIIDDDVSIRRVLRTALERRGYTVDEAGDGLAGVQRFRAVPADLVITDVFMPDQDGIETIQQLRDEFPDCRILAISGGALSGTAATLTDAKLLGADATLAKPFSIDELMEAMNTLLGA